MQEPRRDRRLGTLPGHRMDLIHDAKKSEVAPYISGVGRLHDRIFPRNISQSIPDCLLDCFGRPGSRILSGCAMNDRAAPSDVTPGVRLRVVQHITRERFDMDLGMRASHVSGRDHDVGRQLVNPACYQFGLMLVRTSERTHDDAIAVDDFPLEFLRHQDGCIAFPFFNHRPAPHETAVIGKQ